MTNPDSWCASKASEMFHSQPLGRVICRNYIDYNLILLIFKEDDRSNFYPPPPCPRVRTSLMDAGLVIIDILAISSLLVCF